MEDVNVMSNQLAVYAKITVKYRSVSDDGVTYHPLLELWTTDVDNNKTIFPIICPVKFRSTEDAILAAATGALLFTGNISDEVVVIDEKDQYSTITISSLTDISALSSNTFH